MCWDDNACKDEPNTFPTHYRYIKCKKKIVDESENLIIFVLKFVISKS